MKTKQTIKSYTGSRKEILKILREKPKCVLDVGCSNGALGAAIKETYSDANVTGLEFDDAFVEAAQERLDAVISIDLNELPQNASFGDFDLIIFADVLEHLHTPKEVFQKIIENNALHECYVIVSVPNVQHITVFVNLLFGLWPERDRGLYDRTHLRWFTLRTIKDFAMIGNCEVLEVSRNFRFFDRTGSKFNKLSRLFRFPPFRNFLTYHPTSTDIWEVCVPDCGATQ